MICTTSKRLNLHDRCRCRPIAHKNVVLPVTWISPAKRLAEVSPPLCDGSDRLYAGLSLSSVCVRYAHTPLPRRVGPERWRSKREETTFGFFNPTKWEGCVSVAPMIGKRRQLRRRQGSDQRANTDRGRVLENIKAFAVFDQRIA